MDELYLTVPMSFSMFSRPAITTIDWTGNVILGGNGLPAGTGSPSDYLGNKKDSSLPSMSAKQALTDTDWFETLSVPFGQMRTPARKAIASVPATPCRD
jgi:hypothetical protein